MITFPAYNTSYAPLTGLSPTWHVLVNSETGAAVSPQPTISELSGGLYTIDTDVYRAEAGILDLGASAKPRYLHVDADSRRTFSAFDSSQDPLASLTPTWTTCVYASDGSAVSPQPTFTELGSGLYRVDYTERTAICGMIDLGATATPRYYAFTMDYRAPVSGTTTIKAIVNQHVSTIHALTPASHAGVKYIELDQRYDFDDWAESKPLACFRRFRFEDLTEYEETSVSDSDMEEVTTRLRLSVAYPADGRFGTGTANDVNDVIREDMHQIDTAIGVRGYGSYVAGQSLSKREEIDFERVEGTVLARMEFETRFWRAF